MAAVEPICMHDPALVPRAVLNYIKQHHLYGNG